MEMYGSISSYSNEGIKCSASHEQKTCSMYVIMSDLTLKLRIYSIQCYRRENSREEAMVRNPGLINDMK